MTRKIATIIDLSNIAMRDMFTCQYMGDGSVANFDSEDECAILVRKIASDIAYTVRMLGAEKVVIACDAKTKWRSKLYDEIDNGGYKANRTKDEKKNWENIYASLDDLKSILSVRGMIVSELTGAEADDLAALWRDVLLDEGYDIIMVSSDKDWTQLMMFSENGDADCQFCISYNPVSVKKMHTMFVPQEFLDWYNREDVADIFFSNYDPMRRNIKHIMDPKNSVKMEVIDPEGILLEKVMCGDDGDNVPAFYEYYKNGRKTRVTPLKAGKVFESLGISKVSDLKENADSGNLKEALEREMKKEIDVDFVTRLERQRKLVELNPEMFPENITKAFGAHLDKVEGKGIVNPAEVKLETLLHDTKYVKKDFNKPRMNSIFDDLGALNKYSKTPNLF